MIMRISEDERQEEIRKWETMTRGLENWDRKIDNDKEKNSYCIVTINQYIPFPISIKEILEGPFENEQKARERFEEIVKEKLKDGEKIGMTGNDIRKCYKVVSCELANMYSKRR